MACLILINPIGDFPLNDDWAYGLPVEALLRDRTLKFTDWQGASLVAQIFWGALFCLPIGFSFTALRISSLTLGVMGILGMGLLLRHLGADRRTATFGAAVLAFNPYYLLLAHSFMTDVPFLALMILSIFLLIQGSDLGRDGEIVAGLILACISILIRQIGLMVLIGFLVAYPLRRGFGKRWLLLAVVPTAVAVVLLRSYESYLRLIGELPGQYTSKFDGIKLLATHFLQLRLGALRNPVRISVLLLLYTGLWSLPFSLLTTPRALQRLTLSRRRACLLLVAGVTAGSTALLTLIDWLMPMVGNEWVNIGMGIRNLPGATPGLSRPFWIGMTVLSVAGASLAVLTIALLVGQKWSNRAMTSASQTWFWQTICLLAIGAFNLAPIAFSYSPAWDRYFLVFLPLLLGLLVALGHDRWTNPDPRAWWLAASLLAVYLGFGVAATHDYLAWNRARWTAAAQLQERWGVPKEEIDGGFEYNNLVDARESLRTRLVHRSGVYQIDGSTRPYRLAFEPLADHETLGYVECHAWLPRAISRVYYARKLTAP